MFFVYDIVYSSPKVCAVRLRSLQRISEECHIEFTSDEGVVDMRELLVESICRYSDVQPNGECLSGWLECLRVEQNRQYDTGVRRLAGTCATTTGGNQVRYAVKVSLYWYWFVLLSHVGAEMRIHCFTQVLPAVHISISIPREALHFMHYCQLDQALVSDCCRCEQLLFR